MPPSRQGSEPCPASISEVKPNILIVGETGVGKSSVVNLIAGTKLAKANSGAAACTLEATSYDITLSDHERADHHIRLFDTVGLNEAQSKEFKQANYLSAIEKANTLICQLERTGGVRLLLFCIRGGRITATTQKNFTLFCDILCQNKVSVMLVVTGTENHDPMEKWWEENETLVKTYGLSCKYHTCITATRGLRDRYAEEYKQSQTKVRDMLLVHATGESSPWQTDRIPWFTSVARRLLGWLRGGQKLTEQDLVSSLRRKCKFTTPEAKYLAKKILAEREENAMPDLMELYTPGDPQDFHVILFGGSGVGKSSIVNLIAGDELAKTSPDAGAGTFTSTSYRVNLQSNRPFCIWDTIAVNEPDISLDEYLRAVKQAYKLIKELEKRGGVQLLLFCMRGGSIGKSLQQNYNLFVKVLCGEKVPACVVVTGLEKERRMDDWWATNAKELQKRGISTDGHACITAMSGTGSRNVRDKYRESRERMRSLLLNWELKQSGEVLKNRPNTQELVEKLVNDCGFSGNAAGAVATSIEEIDQLPPGSNE